MSVLPLSEAGLMLVAAGLLWKGADWVVTAACRVARRFELPDAVIGATVVALGTSAPEIVVTLVAALSGRPDISVGNVVGSNIFNLGIILGGCATVWAVPTTRQLVRRDTPALLVASLLLLAFLQDRVLSPWEGFSMMVLLAGYIIFMLRRSALPSDESEARSLGVATPRDYALLGMGLAAVLCGAHLLVASASRLAALLGLSEWAIGVTVVAAGTSLPELATAIAAARRGHVSLMAGTLVGSDLFNVLGVLGLAAFFCPYPLQVSSGALASIQAMIGMILVLILFMRTGWRLTRAEGACLILIALLRWSYDLSPRS